jgi:hypothetical protein
MDILNEIKEIIDLNKVLVKVISLVDNFEWNRAKSIWLLVICQLNPNENLKSAFSLKIKDINFSVSNVLKKLVLIQHRYSCIKL